MKIVHVVENLNRGGLERVVINLVLAQRDSGHDCRVICVHEEGSLAPELTGRGVRVDVCGKRDGTDLRALRRMRQLLRAQSFDVLHSHNIIAHDYATLSARGLAARCVVNTRHGMGAAPAASGREWLYRRCMRWTDHVVAVCEAARSNLVERGGLPAAKVVAVPNGIHVGEFSPASATARQRLADMLGVPASTRLIGFVGRLNWAKDVPTLIVAFALLHARMPDTALVLVGDGSLRAELDECVAAAGMVEHVKFLGDRSDVRELLPGFHLFAMSSVTEGYSIALLEACAAALPIVATDVGGNAEIVHDGENGRIVPPRDAPAFAAALHDVLQDAERAEAMGLAGRAWVLEHGSFDGMVQHYEALYRGVEAARR